MAVNRRDSDEERRALFEKIEMTGRESVADLPEIRRRYNIPRPEEVPDSPLTLADVIESDLYRDLSSPKLGVGDPAFPFTLPKLDMSHGKERDTGEVVRLADYFGVKPVSLIFGSYT